MIAEPELSLDAGFDVHLKRSRSSPFVWSLRLINSCIVEAS